MRRYLTMAEAVVYTGRSAKTLRKAASSGRVRAYKPGGYAARSSRWAFLESDLDDYMQAGANVALRPVRRAS